MRLAALRVVVVLSLSSGARAAAESAAILPVAGDQQLAALLNPALGRAVAGKGQPLVLGPVEVQARLVGERELAAGLERARESIALAREQELRMNRPEAVAAALAAIRTVEEIRGSLYAPELVIRAHTSLAVASLLRPDDQQAASEALRRALALDPGYRPAPGQLSTRATRLLEEARPTARAQRPADHDLGWVAHRLRLSRVLWIRVLAPKTALREDRIGVVRLARSRAKLEVVLYDHGGRRVRTRLQAETTTAELLPRAADLVVQALGGGAIARPRPAPAPAKRWYRRWWVWTVAGVVAAGAAAGIAVAATRTRESHRINAIHLHF
jgi:hypothetical protein